MKKKQIKPHTIEIRNKQVFENQLSCGPRMEVLLDGQRLRGVRGVQFSVGVGGMAYVQLEMYAEVDLTTTTHLRKGKLRSTDYITLRNGPAKGVALYELGNLAPAMVATKQKRKTR